MVPVPAVVKRFAALSAAAVPAEEHGVLLPPREPAPSRHVLATSTALVCALCARWVAGPRGMGACSRGPAVAALTLPWQAPMNNPGMTLAEETARRLLLAGIRPDDPGLVKWLAWNAAVYGRAPVPP